MLRGVHPPSVDTLARQLAAHPDLGVLPHALLVETARAAISEAVAAGEPGSATARAEAAAAERAARLLRPVINATGTLLHTNLGRAPLDPLRGSTAGWRASNLEFDVATGTRGSRRDHASALLARLCEAEAGLVVNNCAAAVMLVLAALGRPHERGEVLVSRGELVEIGGGFRIPDVLEQSGCHLREVGTTNRTRLADYHNAVGANTSMALKVHTSNYRITGFTEEASIAELATLSVPVVADIGSGLIDERLRFLADKAGKAPVVPWLIGEPGARQTLEQGAALAIFSGDKLLGGPQSGVIVGRRELVEACARHPLARALRPGGLVLEALQHVALTYLRGDARSLPFWTMALAPVGELEKRATSICLAAARPELSVVSCMSVPGGGTLPDAQIPSMGIRAPERVAAQLRSTPGVPIVARVEDGATYVDIRTVHPVDDAEVLSGLLRALSKT
jgi:L-seryl-tRNA(Ser) seleniumtransferase